ncbi:helix-turn-helix transcriptional regulator [Shewanella colwelliana]|uniref:helix-turn-helix transcriptional regulator n=1 Tax=Shewanella colwelliana TaxID=23 RepID=UPI000687974A|nr:WYL domain-containing protein [Shewanella colwelliana]
MQTNIQRQLAMLEQIPRHPRRITANAIADRLHSRDFDVGLRTVQRELKSMYDMGLFGLVLDDRCKPFGWSIAACWRGLNLTLMDHHMALAFHTLKHSASQLLPPQSLKQLTPYFERADQVLASDPENPWLYWACRVAQLPEPFPYICAEPDPKSFETIQEALLHKRQIACQIKRVIKGKSYWIDYMPLNPEGIKISNGVVLLAFTIGEFDSRRYVRSIDLLRDIQLLDTPAITRDDFDIAHSGIANTAELIDIELRFTPSANFILSNAKLSENQDVEQLQDGRYRVTASVKDTPRFRAFLWELADNVEIVAPLKLRAHFTRLISKVSSQYQTVTTKSVAATS